MKNKIRNIIKKIIVLAIAGFFVFGGTPMPLMAEETNSLESQEKDIGEPFDATTDREATYSFSCDEYAIPIILKAGGDTTFSVNTTGFQKATGDEQSNLLSIYDDNFNFLLGGSVDSEKTWNYTWGGKEQKAGFLIFKKGSRESGNNQEITVTISSSFKAYEFTDTGWTLKDGDQVSADIDKEQTVYWDFSLDCISKVSINGRGIKICDADKTELDTVYAMAGEPVDYILDSGNYFIEAYNPRGITHCEFSFNIHKIEGATCSNTSKETARAIKLDETVSGVNLFGIEQMYYYKMKISKPRKISATYQLSTPAGKTPGLLRLYITNKKGKILHTGSDISMFDTSQDYNGQFIFMEPKTEKTKINLQKGTYYFVIEADNNIGEYSFSIK